MDSIAAEFPTDPRSFLGLGLTCYDRVNLCMYLLLFQTFVLKITHIFGGQQVTLLLGVTTDRFVNLLCPKKIILKFVL